MIASVVTRTNCPDIRLRGRGFTIIEVLIVIAVSGILFIAAAVTIAGKQDQAAFDQSIRQIQSQIQQTINEVSIGYYPSRSDFQCVAGSPGEPPTLSSGVSSRGTNSGCIFLGKAMQFGVNGTNAEQFIIYTITGLQAGVVAGTESASLAEARPAVVAPSVTHSSADYPDNSVTDVLQNGLTASRAWYNNGGGDVEIGAVAFVNSLAQYGGGAILSGSGQVNVIPVDTTTLGSDKSLVAQAMNSDGGNRLVTSPINPSGGIFICFASGGTDQYGIVKIGGSGRELAVTLQIKNNIGAPCS